MCGIAGLVFDVLEPQGAAWLTEMTQSMIHRGPDGGGAVVFGLGGRPAIERRLAGANDAVKWDYLPAQVALGARRLAILDPSETGAQPMCSPDRRTWIVFNGAIYNFRDLRRELEAAGMSFRGSSDTEVLLGAFRHWGAACFERLEGMWATAIYDQASQELVLSRDRLGIKPLYLTKLRGGVAFASEIKALLALPDVEREVEQRLLCDFLSRGLVDHTDRTLFSGVWSLPAGCCLRAPLASASLRSKWRLERYWVPRRAARHVESPGATATVNTSPDAIRRELERAVASHLVSDVSVGSCLSGGIDSSSVVSLIHRQMSGSAVERTQWSQQAFTACLPGRALDESRYAEAVVRSCEGLQWRRTSPTAAGLAGELDRLVWHQEQPFGSPSIYMQWAVMRAAHESGAVVLLDGQGGDELFCGYEGYVPPFLAHALRHARFGSFLRAQGAAVQCGYFSRGALAWHMAGALAPRTMRDAARGKLRRFRDSWLVGDLFDAEPEEDLRAGLGLAGPGEPLQAQSAFEEFAWRMLLSESLPALLRYEDRSSMAFSIEARVPLLDRAMVELAMSIPPERKIQDGVLKAPLRAAMRGIVPDEILDRRDKIGFSAPTADWMRGELAEWWREAIGSKTFRERGCFSPRGIAKLARRFEQGDDRAALPLWRAAIVESWARRFLDGPPRIK